MARTSVQTDDFADNDLSTGSVVWAQLNGGFGVMGNTGGEVFNNHSVAEIRANGTYTDDQYSKLKATVLTNNSAAAYIGVIARASADTDANRDYYFFHISFGESLGGPFTYILGKRANGTATTLKTGTVAFAVNDTVEIEVDGGATTHIRGYVNGTLVDSYDDSSSPFTTGKPGLEMGNSIVRADDWEGGNLTAGGGTTPLSFTGSDSLAGGELL